MWKQGDVHQVGFQAITKIYKVQITITDIYLKPGTTLSTLSHPANKKAGGDNLPKVPEKGWRVGIQTKATGTLNPWGSAVLMTNFPRMLNSVWYSLFKG